MKIIRLPKSPKPPEKESLLEKLHKNLADIEKLLNRSISEKDCEE